MMYNRRSPRFADLIIDPNEPARMISPLSVQDDVADEPQPQAEDVACDAETEAEAVEQPEVASCDATDGVPAADASVEDESPATQPVPRRSRGRPKAATKPPVVIIHPELPLMDFSLTVVQRGRHINPSWLKVVYEFLLHYGERCLVSLERGGNAEHLHIQGVFSSRMLQESVEEMKKRMKESLNVKRGDGQGWYVRIDRTRHTFDRHLRYCRRSALKMRTLRHKRTRVHCAPHPMLVRCCFRSLSTYLYF